MDKSLLNAVISSLTKEEIEKRTPELRRSISKELENYIKSKSFKTNLIKAIEGGLTDMLDDDFHDYLDNSTVQRIIRKTVNKIVK